MAQGHVMDDIALTQPAVSYLDPPLLMRNVNGKFIDVSASSGAPFRIPLPARGAAIGDLDNDGWLDIAMNCNDRAPVILRNRGGPGHWLQVDAPPGSTVAVRTSAGLVQHGFASTAGSYLSSNDPRVHFGLGEAGKATVVVTLPNGQSREARDA
ncbi:MAG: CRTAC1 family protein, partial [Betaproteobacteria bacterium]|nr:CRTAC1 family protein [Betaproteobacteria bacterium]